MSFDSYMIRCLLVTCVACTGSDRHGAEPSTGRSPADQPASADAEVTGVEDEGTRNQVRETVDTALRKNGNLRSYGDLSVGLRELARSNYIHIHVLPDSYKVQIVPHSSQGHDFSFRVDPRTLTLHDVVVGEIASE